MTTTYNVRANAQKPSQRAMEKLASAAKQAREKHGDDAQITFLVTCSFAVSIGPEDVETWSPETLREVLAENVCARVRGEFTPQVMLADSMDDWTLIEGGSI